MPRIVSELHLPPLSTRTIFLHHRVRMHEQASRRVHRAGQRGEATPPGAWVLFTLLILSAAMLLGALHA